MNRKFLYTISVLGLLIPFLTFSVQAQGTDIVSPAGEFPIVSEPITIKILIATGEAVSDFNDNAYTQWLEEKSGLDLEIEVVAATDAQTKLNIVLASGDLPDVLMGFTPTAGVVAYMGSK